MPPAAEPVRWRLLNAAKAAFAAMTTTAYFHVPEEVAIIEPPITQYLDRFASTTKVAYGLFAEDELPTAIETSLGKESLDLVVWIQGVKRFAAERQNPFVYEANSITTEEQFRAEMIHDARKVILSEWRSIGGGMLGGIADEWIIDGVYPLFARHVETSGWIGFEMATTIRYEYKKNDPTST